MRELFLVRDTRRVNKKHCCVSVEGRLFQCDTHLRGQQVQVRFDPRDLSSVTVHTLAGAWLQRALPQAVNAPEPHRSEPEQHAQSVDYLGLLREEYDRKIVEQARPLAYATLELDESFGVEDFARVLAELAGLALRAAERREVLTFWETYGPLPEPLVRIALEQAVRLRGRRRNPQVYLHAIRTPVHAHWKTPKEES